MNLPLVVLRIPLSTLHHGAIIIIEVSVMDAIIDLLADMDGLDKLTRENVLEFILRLLPGALLEEVSAYVAAVKE